MRIHRTFIGMLAGLICSAAAIQPTPSLPRDAARGDNPRTAWSVVADHMLAPADLFPHFPNVAWGMSFQDAKAVIEKSGVHPVPFKDAQTELAWDGKFDGMNGRATVLFKEGTGAFEIAVLVYAREKRKDVFNAWQKRLIEMQGEANQRDDNSIATSNLWTLKNGLAIELRLLKDDDNPVVDIHWVKE